MAEMIHVSGFYLGDGEDKPVNLMIEDMLERNGKGSRECFKST